MSPYRDTQVETNGALMQSSAVIFPFWKQPRLLDGCVLFVCIKNESLHIVAIQDGRESWVSFGWFFLLRSCGLSGLVKISLSLLPATRYKIAHLLKPYPSDIDRKSMRRYVGKSCLYLGLQFIVNKFFHCWKLLLEFRSLPWPSNHGTLFRRFFHSLVSSDHLFVWWTQTVITICRRVWIRACWFTKI